MKIRIGIHLALVGFALSLGPVSGVWADDATTRYVSLTGANGIGLMQFTCDTDCSTGDPKNITLGTTFYGDAAPGDAFPSGQTYDVPVCTGTGGGITFTPQWVNMDGARINGQIICRLSGVVNLNADLAYSGGSAPSGCKLTYRVNTNNFDITGCSDTANNDSGTYKIRTSVPEPGTFAMFGTGLLVCVRMARKRRCRAGRKT